MNSLEYWENEFKKISNTDAVLGNKSIEKFIRADLSKKTAGELLLYNLRRIKEYPYPPLVFVCNEDDLGFT